MGVVERSGREHRRSQLGRVAIDVAATVGYDAMSIADIADAAGVVRRTFSRYFPDKRSAFEYGYREVSEELRAVVQAAYEAASTSHGRARECLRAIAEFLASDPARAEALVVHGHAAGSVVAEIHRETMRRMAVLIRRNAAGLVPPDGDPRMLAETVAGGIYGVVYARVAQGGVRELPEIVEEWSVVAMAPYAVIARRGTGMSAGAGGGGSSAAEVAEPQSSAGVVVGSGCNGR